MPRLLVILGPTATGKTELAVAVARRAGAEIVGADASQVYRGLDIGTGKATPEELGGVAHHLLDVADPGQTFDAATYARLADAAIAEATARGRPVVVCGGSGLYLRALLQGLCEAPPVASEIRAALRARLDAEAVEALHAELARVDPAAAARIGPRDAQRIERALGVYQTTGRPLTDWQAASPAAPRHEAVLLGLDLPRDVLRERIVRRVASMFRTGLVGEVAALLAAGHEPAAPAFGALGYRAVAAHLRGEIDLEEAERRTVRDSQRYAKRQQTWFRALPGVHWRAPPVALHDPILADWISRP